VARDGGFELRGFHYSSSLPLEARQAMGAALEQALKAIRADLRAER
jgi:hypothetical protein